MKLLSLHKKLDVSKEIVWVYWKVVVTRIASWLVCNSAWIDASNIEWWGKNEGDKIILLPEDCDLIAEEIRNFIEWVLNLPLSVIITDSMWTEHWNDNTPWHNIADEVAYAAGLIMWKWWRGKPVVVVRGVNYERDVKQTQKLLEMLFSNF